MLGCGKESYDNGVKRGVVHGLFTTWAAGLTPFQRPSMASVRVLCSAHGQSSYTLPASNILVVLCPTVDRRPHDALALFPTMTSRSPARVGGGGGIRNTTSCPLARRR